MHIYLSGKEVIVSETRRSTKLWVAALLDTFHERHTNDAYNASCKEYIRVKGIKQSDLRLATVLDLFGGVGAGILALKKIGIGMEKVSCVSWQLCSMTTAISKMGQTKSVSPIQR